MCVFDVVVIVVFAGGDVFVCVRPCLHRFVFVHVCNTTG